MTPEPALPICVRVGGFLGAAVLGSWCMQTAWRLFTAREQRRGGLLSPAVLILVGFGFTAGALGLVARRGISGIAGGAVLGVDALACFAIARSRLTVSRTGVDGPSPKRLQRTARKVGSPTRRG